MSKRSNTACHERGANSDSGAPGTARDRARRFASSAAPASECLTVAPAEDCLTVAPVDECLTSASAPAVDGTAPVSTGQLLVFRIADRRYALPIDRVREIQRVVAFAGEGFGGPVLGMVDLRGMVIAAVDARALLGLGRGNLTLDTQMVICGADGDPVALLVDKVDDVVEPPEGPLRSAPKRHALASKTLGVMGSGDELVLVLDLASVLAGVDELVEAPPPQVSGEARRHEA